MYVIFIAQSAQLDKEIVQIHMENEIVDFSWDYDA